MCLLHSIWCAQHSPHADYITQGPLWWPQKARWALISTQNLDSCFGFHSVKRLLPWSGSLSLDLSSQSGGGVFQVCPLWSSTSMHICTNTRVNRSSCLLVDWWKSNFVCLFWTIVVQCPDNHLVYTSSMFLRILGHRLIFLPVRFLYLTSLKIHFLNQCAPVARAEQFMLLGSS